MKDCLIDGLLDTLKLIPYLFITFLLLEFIEHKLSKKSDEVLKKNKKYGPIIGGILGGIPQCGFSAMASNLYSSRVITIGTLIAIFLSTSDEMLPIMFGSDMALTEILKIVGFKILVGIIVGLIMDFIYRKKIKTEHEHIKETCDSESCHCDEQGIFLSSLIHTLKITGFVLIANILINLVIFKIGEDNLSKMLQNKNIIVYLIVALFGLIPNCASSVIITELYLADPRLISLGTMMTGLLTGSGIGILLLFKSNKNLKENISILSIILIVGIIVGLLVDLII